MSNTVLIPAKGEIALYLKERDQKLARVIDSVGDLSYEVHDDHYSFLVHEIIEQMLSVKAARKIYSRFSDLCGGNVSPMIVNSLSLESIRLTGTSVAKASYIQNLTHALLSGQLCFDEMKDKTDQEIIQDLTSIRGIGTWTAKMYLIFCLDRRNVLPFEDAAFLQSFSWLYSPIDLKPATVKSCCKQWEPYCSIAARYLYIALDSGLTANSG